MQVNIGFISLGCAKNQVDLEHLAGTLFAGKFNFVDDPTIVDLMIINTCGFIHSAVQEAINTILSVKVQLPPNAKLIVFGCMVERYKDEIASELPEIDFFAGVGEQEKILNYINNVFPNTDNQIISERYLFNLPYYAYLKIAEGCDNRCTYCTIPSIRGNHVSIAAEKLLMQAKQLVLNGAKEIIVISQDSSKYGSDLIDINIAKLMDMLAENLPNTYFRIMYINPDGVTSELIDVISAHNNILHYFDIPIQHASDSVLKRMGRKSNKSQIEHVFKMIRTRLPDAIIRTTIIVGFPGETDEDFAEIKNFISEYKPDYAGFFIYSPEDNTLAAKMKDQVPEKIAKSRLKTLQSIQKKNTVNRLRQFKKGEIVCFVEKTNDDFSFILEGRATFQAPEVDGQLYVTDGTATAGYGPYRAKINKIAYPDVYVELIGEMCKENA